MIYRVRIPAGVSLRSGGEIRIVRTGDQVRFLLTNPSQQKNKGLSPSVLNQLPVS